MNHLSLSLDASQARIDHLRRAVAREPEFANWCTPGVSRDTYLVQLWPVSSLTQAEAILSARKVARALGGKWVDSGAGRWENRAEGFMLYVDPVAALERSARDVDPLADDSDLVAPLVMNR